MPDSILDAPATDNAAASEAPAQQQQSEATDWRAGLDPALAGEKSLSSVKDVNALARGYVEAQKYIGGAVRVPADDAPAEEWNKFYAKLGRPEAPGKYDVKLDEGLTWQPDRVEGLKAKAHELGLTPRQLQGLVDYYAGVARETQTALGPSASEATEVLKKEWGATFQRNIEMARRAAKAEGGDELIQLLQSVGLDNHPVLVKMWARVGNILAEDGAIVGDIPGVPNAEAAKQKIAEIMADPNHAYHKKGTVGHEEAHEYVTGLFRLAYDTP